MDRDFGHGHISSAGESYHHHDRITDVACCDAEPVVFEAKKTAQEKPEEKKDWFGFLRFLWEGTKAIFWR